MVTVAHGLQAMVCHRGGTQTLPCVTHATSFAIKGSHVPSATRLTVPLLRRQWLSAPNVRGMETVQYRSKCTYQTKGDLHEMEMNSMTLELGNW